MRTYIHVAELHIASERGRISVELGWREGNTANQKTMVFCIFSRIRNAKFLLVKIQFD